MRAKKAHAASERIDYLSINRLGFLSRWKRRFFWEAILTDTIIGRERSRLTVWQFFKGLAKVVVGGALLLQALLFLVIMAMILSIMSGIQNAGGAAGEKPKLEIKAGSALVFDPAGILAEKAPDPDPVQEALNEAFGGDTAGQVSVHELVRVLEKAQGDDRISTLILDFDSLIIPDIYLSKAHLLADAIEAFRESGKRVVAVGDGYGQNQYLVASEADTVLMHDQGFLFMSGYGRYRTYYSSLLDNLDVTKNIFRVGTYKSALEPVLRDNMSEAAREANEAYLSVLWNSYTSRIDENRGLSEGTTVAFANDLVEQVRTADGDLAAATLNGNYVDQLVDRAGQRRFLVDLVGEDEDGELNAVSLKKYRTGMKGKTDRDDVPNVAVVTVEGAIIDGPQEPGVASGEYVSEQLREAREDDDVKAVVLRVDSPGGSVFASELIRDEVLALKEAGKPVIASMSSIAASGGYWISAGADAIYAQPTTITGSIGIFAYLPTFENLAAKYGVFTDGVGTTPLSGFSAIPVGEIPEAGKELFQLSIERGYRDFLEVVSSGRGIPTERVDEIAQGRVWVGTDAHDRQLVDQFGSLNDAVADAAQRAGLEDYDVTGLVKEKTPFQLFIESLGAEAEAMGIIKEDRTLFGIGSDRFDQTTLGAAAKLIEQETRFQASFSDPNGLYARCLECGAF